MRRKHFKRAFFIWLYFSGFCFLSTLLVDGMVPAINAGEGALYMSAWFVTLFDLIGSRKEVAV